MSVSYLTRPADGVATWVAEQVAEYVDLPPEQIEPTLPLAEYGLDSVSAVGLCGAIERRFDIPVDPTLVFDYPTIDLIAGFIVAAAAPAALPA